MKKMQSAKCKAQCESFFTINKAGFYVASIILHFALCILASSAFAVPETTAVRIADVTTSSFSLVWMTDVAADPSVEVYADNSMQQRITEGIRVTALPAGSGAYCRSC